MRFALIFSRRILVMLLCIFLMAGCNPATEATISARSPLPLQVVSSPWKANPLPVPGHSLLSYAVSPIDSETMYACTGDVFITLWETHNAGQHWFPISLPATSGNECSFSIFASQPQRIAFLVTDAHDSQRPCDRDTLYLSSDSGKTWKHISHPSIAPLGTISVYCALTVTDRYLYMLTSYQGVQNTPQLSLLERTDNDGASWSRIDTAFGPGSLFSSPEVGLNGTLAISVRHTLHAFDATVSLWMSHDAGRSWQRMGMLPPQAGTFLLATPQRGSAWPSQATPFYALAGEQLPSNLYRLRVFESMNGWQWFAVPPLSVPYASLTRAGLVQSLSVTDGGQFLAFGVDPKIGVPATSLVGQPMPAFWLWSWNPRTAHWQVLSSVLSHPEGEGCGLCWNGQFSKNEDHTRILSVYHLQDRGSFFRVKLPELA
jgi:hypothetical protein